MVIVIRLLISLSKIGTSVNTTGVYVSLINKHLGDIKVKGEIIENSAKKSLPFFLKIILGITVIREISKDYFDTKPGKRSLRKSFKKTYKHRLRKI